MSNIIRYNENYILKEEIKFSHFFYDFQSRHLTINTTFYISFFSTSLCLRLQQNECQRKPKSWKIYDLWSFSCAPHCYTFGQGNGSGSERGHRMHLSFSLAHTSPANTFNAEEVSEKKKKKKIMKFVTSSSSSSDHTTVRLTWTEITIIIINIQPLENEKEENDWLIKYL